MLLCIEVVQWWNTILFGNDDITQEDNMRRQILLSLQSIGSSRSYTLQFDFVNTDVDWLVLSETRLCRVPLQGTYINTHNHTHTLSIETYNTSNLNKWLTVYTYSNTGCIHIKV